MVIRQCNILKILRQGAFYKAMDVWENTKGFFTGYWRIKIWKKYSRKLIKQHASWWFYLLYGSFRFRSTKIVSTKQNGREISQIAIFDTRRLKGIAISQVFAWINPPSFLPILTLMFWIFLSGLEMSNEACSSSWSNDLYSKRYSMCISRIHHLHTQLTNRTDAHYSSS